MRLRFGIPLAAALILFSSAAPARADVVLTPFVGGLFGGYLPDAQPTYGVSASFMGAGIIGFEADFGYTPKFLSGTSTAPTVRAMNLMGNVIIGIPIGGTQGAGVRPYATGGIGLFRATAKESDFLDPINARNDFAVNVGGGIMGFFTDKVGLRGDLRYFRRLSDDDLGSGVDFSLSDVDFWRASIGLAFKF